MHADHAIAVAFGKALFGSIDAVFVVVVGDVPTDQVDGCFFENTRGIAVGITVDVPTHWIRGIAGDAGDAHGSMIDPGRVAVFAGKNRWAARYK